MFTHLGIQNFQCLRHVEVPVRALTVLVGANDTGKSAFLDAVLHLSSGTGLERTDVWRMDPNLNAELDGITTSGHVHLSSTGQRKVIGPQTFLPVASFQLPSTGVSMQSGGQDDSRGPPMPDASGTGVPTVLDYYLRRERGRFDRVIEVMKELVPGLEDIRIPTPDPQHRQVNFVVEHGLEIFAGRASAGVRLLLFFVALAHHPKPPRLILLEEPENGIHPKRLSEVIDLLRDLTAGKYGDHPAQVIMTTHSPYLLDLIDLEKDQVLVFRRNKDGSRTAEPVDAARLEAFLGEFMLGEVWYNQGEEGLVARTA